MNFIRDMPKLAKTTSTTQTSTSKGTGLPSLKTSTSTSGLPALTTGTTSSSYTTPAVTVPPSNNNPYLIHTENPNGTVFIAVGVIVGAILLGFILYHFIISLTASRLAKKSLAPEKQMYEKYQYNNSNAYGYGFDTQSTSDPYSVAKLPLLTKPVLGGGLGNSNLGSTITGDTSTIYQSEIGHATSKHDLTKMFISPTAEVMQHKRTRSGPFGSSTTNVSMLGGSTSNLHLPATNRHSQLIPSLYINNEVDGSEFSLAPSNNTSVPGSQSNQTRKPRKTIPSMYLEDLMDGKKSSSETINMD
jgi:hypothetical protein